jgi:hypothetical protein
VKMAILAMLRITLVKMVELAITIEEEMPIW